MGLNRSLQEAEKLSHQEEEAIPSGFLGFSGKISEFAWVGVCSGGWYVKTVFHDG